MAGKGKKKKTVAPPGTYVGQFFFGENTPHVWDGGNWLPFLEAVQGKVVSEPKEGAEFIDEKGAPRIWDGEKFIPHEEAVEKDLYWMPDTGEFINDPNNPRVWDGDKWISPLKAVEDGVVRLIDIADPVESHDFDSL